MVLAGIEDNDTLGKTHHSPHNVFDHDDADATCVERRENGQDLVHLRLESPAMASSEINSRGLAAMARASSSLRNSIRLRWAER